MDEKTKVTLRVLSEQNLKNQVDIRQRACKIIRQLREEGHELKKIIKIVQDLNVLVSSLF